MKLLSSKQSIINCYHQNINQETTAKIVGVSQSYVSQVISTFKREGEASLIDKRINNGTDGLLSEAQLSELKELLVQPASDYGFEGDLWNKTTIKALIAEKFNVDYHPNYISSIMKKIGFSSQKPALKDHRQDVAKVIDYKQTTAPKLKKKQRKKIEK